jgi:transposase
MKADTLFADKAYDTNDIIAYAQARGMKIVIPPKKNRVVQREYDEELYKLRHLVENAILKLKRWRGIATRYAKNSNSFLAAVFVRCICLWITM